MLHSYPRKPSRGSAVSSPPPSLWLSPPGRLSRGVRSCAQLYSEGRWGGRWVRQLDRKTDPDRWEEIVEDPRSNVELFFSPGSSCPLSPRRCPVPPRACFHGPHCGWYLWQLWLCSRCSLPPTPLPPFLRTRDLQTVGSVRASWRGLWFSWTSTLAVRSESSTTTSSPYSWTHRSSKTAGWTSWGTNELPCLSLVVCTSSWSFYSLRTHVVVTFPPPWSHRRVQWSTFRKSQPLW